MAKGKDAAKPAVVKDPKEAQKLVLEFFLANNRPYNVVNVIDGSQGRLKKAVVEAAVTALVEKKKLQIREIKKAKFYMANQDQFDVPDEKELAGKEASIKEMEDEVKKLNDQVNKAGSSLKELKGKLTTEEMEAEVARLTESNAAKKERVAALKDGKELMSAAERAKMFKRYESVRSSWKKYRRLANDMVEAMCGDVKKPSDLRKEVGVETDEQAKFTLDDADLEALQPPAKKQKTK